MNISKHCYQRAKERLGLNHKAFEKMVETAISKGLTHGVTKGNLHKWVDVNSPP